MLVFTLPEKLPLNRTRLIASFAFCLALFCAAPEMALAQDAEPDAEVVSINTDLLVFPIRVKATGKLGLDSLSPEALTLTDKDQATSGVSFYRGVDRVALVFALDRSGSIRNVISQQRDAALGLFGRFGARSRVAVVSFSESSKVIAPFDRDTSSAREAFDLPAAVNQHTAIFDAAAHTIELFDQLPRVRSERRIVILFSDGLDNASRAKAKTVVETANKNLVSFYVIHIPLFEPRDGRLSVRTPSSGFKDLAEKTGGKYFLVNDASFALSPSKQVDLTPIFKAIEDDLNSQFLLGFYLAERANDGQRHEFSLAMPRGFEYRIRNRGFDRTQRFYVHRPKEFLKRLP